MLLLLSGGDSRRSKDRREAGSGEALSIGEALKLTKAFRRVSVQPAARVRDKSSLSDSRHQKDSVAIIKQQRPADDPLVHRAYRISASVGG